MTVAPGSPLHVTEYSDQLLKERNPTTNYDIQKDSIRVIGEALESDHDVAICLKEYAFNKGLDINVLSYLTGIALCDEVMKAH